MAGGPLTCAAIDTMNSRWGGKGSEQLPSVRGMAVLPYHVLFAGAGGPIVINIRKSVTSQFPSGIASQHPMVTAGAHFCGYLPIQAI